MFQNHNRDFRIHTKGCEKRFIRKQGKTINFFFKTYRRRGNNEDKIVASMASASQAIDRCFYYSMLVHHYSATCHALTVTSVASVLQVSGGVL
jgi:hypothetical protein